MTNHQPHAQRPTPQESALIDAHAQRAAELRIQHDQVVLRSLATETISRASADSPASPGAQQRQGRT